MFRVFGAVWFGVLGSGFFGFIVLLGTEIAMVMRFSVLLFDFSGLQVKG